MNIDPMLNELIGRTVTDLAQKFPGFPISIIWDGFHFELGIIGLELEPDDWFILPGRVDRTEFELQESTAPRIENEKPQTAAARGSDPDRTRTYNQLIKSQLLVGEPKK